MQRHDSPQKEAEGRNLQYSFSVALEWRPLLRFASIKTDRMVLSIFLPSLHLDICNTLGTILDPGKVIFGHLIDFGHFPIEAENFLGRAFQLS